MLERRWMDAVDDASQPLDFNALFTYCSLSVKFLPKFESPIRFPKAAGVPSLRYCTRTAVTRPV